MARKKISEFRSKTLLSQNLSLTYKGISIDTNNEGWEELVRSLAPDMSYVVKVDQGVKGRKKKGLVYLGRNTEEAVADIRSLTQKGYRHFIIEEFLPHEESQEHYLAILRTRDGNELWYSKSGGIEIEEHGDSIEKTIINSTEDIEEVAGKLNIEKEILSTILDVFDTYYFSFLEINPLVVREDGFYLLDTAVEVDSAAEFFVGDGWGREDFREFSLRIKSDEEIAIEELSEKSQASFSFTLLNPHGSIFLLLSGGGASLVLADEIFQQGKGGELANYGEYSGNPNQEETYIYTKNVLSLLTNSESLKKVLIIGGGVANFTDIRITFSGVIKALEEYSDQLKEQGVKVYVRRGGPHQKEGLSQMENFLREKNILGHVSDQSLILTEIVKPALEQL